MTKLFEDFVNGLQRDSRYHRPLGTSPLDFGLKDVKVEVWDEADGEWGEPLDIEITIEPKEDDDERD